LGGDALKENFRTSQMVMVAVRDFDSEVEPIDPNLIRVVPRMSTSMAT